MMRDQMRTYARQLLHAFAEADSLPTTQEAQPLVGPNGGLIWTEFALLRREYPHSDHLQPTADEALTTSHRRTDIRRPEPISSSLEAPAV
jgi:hypothetical protein